MHPIYVPIRFVLLVLVLAPNCIWLAQSENRYQTADKLTAKYIIGLDTDNTYAASKEDSSDGSKYIRMANSSGHSFECTVPPSSIDQAQSSDQLGVGKHPEITAEAVLESLSARCFYRLEDWWTYEICYQQHVRQFHREKDVLAAEYLLGVYHQDSADTDTLQGEANSGDSGRYVKETYDQGDACDLTGQTRQTEVRYVCSEGGQENVLSIKEPSTCHYVLTVAVPGLCQLPIFRAQPEPITQIVCRPIAAPSAEDSSLDHGSQQQQHANLEDGDLVQDDSGHESSANSTELDHHDS